MSSEWRGRLTGTDGSNPFFSAGDLYQTRSHSDRSGAGRPAAGETGECRWIGRDADDDHSQRNPPPCLPAPPSSLPSGALSGRDLSKHRFCNARCCRRRKPMLRRALLQPPSRRSSATTVSGRPPSPYTSREKAAAMHRAGEPAGAWPISIIKHWTARRPSVLCRPARGPEGATPAGSRRVANRQFGADSRHSRGHESCCAQPS